VKSAVVQVVESADPDAGDEFDPRPGPILPELA
jgi:hypothetical protein